MQMNLEINRIHVGQTLKDFIKSQQSNTAKFAEIIGVTREHAYKILSKEDVNTDVLKKVADFFDVSFLDIIQPNRNLSIDSVAEDRESYNNSKDLEILYLKELLKAKDETIEALKRSANLDDN